MPQACRWSVAVAAALALCFHAAAPARAEVALGAATPQALMARMIKAADAGDFAEIIACVDPASRSELSLGLVMATTMMVAFMSMGSEMAGGMAEGLAEGLAGEMKPEEKAKAEKSRAEAAAKVAQARAGLTAIFKKHGLPDLMDDAAVPKDEGAAAALLAKADHAALAGDLLKFMETFGDGPGTKDGKATALGPVNVPRSVTDYKIMDARATARAGAETLEFVKVGDRWFFKPPQKSDPPDGD